MNSNDWIHNDDGVWIYRASSLGSCTRSLTAARLGESALPPGQRIQDAMAASAAREDEGVELYEKASGHTVVDQQKRVELTLPIHNEAHADIVGVSPVLIRGHMDGVDEQDLCVVEVKWLSGTNFARYDLGGLANLGYLARKYRIQRNVYGLAVGKGIRMVICNKHAEGEEDLLIIDPPLDQPPYMPDDVDRRELERIVQTVEVHAEQDWLPDCDADCKQGDAYSECHIFEGPTIVDDANLEKLLLRHQELKILLGSDDKNPEKRGGLLGEFADIKDELKSLGNDMATERFAVGKFNLTVVANKGRESVDSYFLRKNYPDVYAESLKLGSPYRTVIVKKAK